MVATTDAPNLHDEHLGHDLPCSGCGHSQHPYLPCSDACACSPPPTPGL